MSDNKDIQLYAEKLKPAEILKLCPILVEKHHTLTNKQKAFVWYYCNNGTDKLDAVIKAGYTTSKTGKKKRQFLFVQANQMLYNPKIQKAIKDVLNDQIGMRKTALEHNLFEKLIKIINLDICDYLEDDGTVKSKLSDIPKAIRQMIVKTEVKYYGKDAQVRVLTLEFLGKQWAFDKLMNYINMIKDNPTTINLISDDMKVNMMNLLQGKSLPGDKGK